MRSGKRKIKEKHRLLIVWILPFLLLLTLSSGAQIRRNNTFNKQATKQDSVQNKLNDSLQLKRKADSLKIQRADTSVLSEIADTTKKVSVTDTLDLSMYSKDSIEAPINYSAEDSGILNIPQKTFYLYGKANAKYTDMDITSAVIELDNDKGIFKAYGVKDSTGKTVDLPKMVQADMTSISDSLIYDTKSRRGITKTTYTQQGEMYVYAERIKKNYDNSYFAYRSRFTTCNLDTPHFAFRTRKMKLVGNKWAFSGLTYPEFEGVPLPIGIPFGIYPLSRGRHSGMLPPTFTATQYFGIGLEGLGYYKVLSDNVDLTVRSNIYSYGGYVINLVPTYRVRYRYNGGFNISYTKTKFNFKGDPDFSSNNLYSFGWSHTVDSKARPGTNFSSNVNISSTRFNQSLPNNPQANFQNQLTSSVQYSKQWGGGKYNLQTSAQHSQNNVSKNYDISLPNITFNVASFYPLKKKERIGAEKWYEKLGISYNNNVLNRFSFSDTVDYKGTRNQSLLQHILDTTQWGVTHNIPILLSLPNIGPLSIAPGISYQEKWYGERIIREDWDPVTKQVGSRVERGFFTAREVTTSLGFQTALFGTYQFQNKDLIAIRHTIRPTLSINYKPDLVRKYYQTIKVDSLKREVRYSTFETSPVGGFGEGQFGGMSFGIIQQLQAKVKDKSDTTGKATKKISLIDNFSITSGYNMFADSNKLSDIAIYMGTTLFNKINITGSTTLIPYELNRYGTKTARYAWQGDNGFSLGTFNNASVSINTSIQSKKGEEKKKQQQQQQTGNESTYYNPEEDIRMQEYIRNHPSEFTDFDIPWTLSMSFSFNVARIANADYSGFRTTTNASLNLQGDFSLTPKWKIGGSTYFDAKERKISQLSMFITRDLHCWQMSINITPVGLYNSFNISINPKSSILRDLKVNRTRSFTNIL